MTYEGFAELEKRGWTNGTIVSGYIDLFAPASNLAIPGLVAGIDPDTRVLDLCCGHGNVSEALLARGCRVTGIDFSGEMLAHARQRLPDGEFIEMDVQDLTFADAVFDAVVCNFGLIHVADQSRALAQVRRVLKPGGHFAMTAWFGPDVSPTFQVFYSSVQAHGDPQVKMPDGPNFHQFADEAMARRMLADAGLRLESHQKIDCHWLFDSADGLAETFEKGAPRGGYLLSQQPDDHRAAIKGAIADQVRARFKHGDHWRVPVPAALITAAAT